MSIRITCAVLCILVVLAPSLVLADTYPSATAHNSYSFNFYTLDQLHTFGTAVTTNVTAGTSYVGIGSTVTAVDPYVAPTDDHQVRLYEPNVIHQPSSIPDFLGTTAVVRAGTNSSGVTQTVSMAWRNRTDIEVNSVGYPMLGLDQFPPMAWDSYGITSDVVDLQGVVGAYVLEMTYRPDMLVWEAEWVTEEWLAANRKIFSGGSRTRPTSPAAPFPTCGNGSMPPKATRGPAS